MKNLINIFAFILVLASGKIKGQAITYNINPPSCLTCCDGSFTMTANGSYLIHSTAPVLETASYNLSNWTFTNVCSGTYQIEMIPICGPNITKYFTMAFLTGMPSTRLDQDINSMFPNPARDFVNFKLDLPGNKKSGIIINDLGGRLVKEINLSSSTTVLDVSNYENGFYFVNIIFDGKIVETKRLVITK